MIISYQSRELRDSSIDDFLSFYQLTEEAREKLKFILTTLAAGDTLQDIPAQNDFYFEKDTLQVNLSSDIVAQFSIANKSHLGKSENYDWKTVSRLKLKYIGENSNDTRFSA